METSDREQIAGRISECFPGCTFADDYGMPGLSVPADCWKRVCAMLAGEFAFCSLLALWAVDKESEGIEILVHIRTGCGEKNLVVKTLLPREPFEVDSLCEIWCSAELYEDEIYDLFGVAFNGHPFLRRLFLADDFQGYPLRKNYGKILEPNTR